MATDLGRGEPMEHCLRQTVIALRIADRIGVGERDRVASYYTGLLANVYCHANAHEQAEWFGDDILAKHGAYDPNVFEFLRMIGASERGGARARKVAGFPSHGVAPLKNIYDTHTRVAELIVDVVCQGRLKSAPLAPVEKWPTPGRVCDVVSGCERSEGA